MSLSKVLILVFVLASGMLRAESYVFMRETESAKQIVLSKDGQFVALTPAEKVAIYPDISPDGKSLVYVTGLDTENLTIEEMDILSKQTTAVTKFSGFALHPKYARNGRLIFYSRQEMGTQKIVLAEKNSSEFQERVLDIQGDLYFPNPTSDAGSLVFQRNLSKTKREIIERNMLSGEEQIIAEGMSPSISKNDQFIAYSSKIDGVWQVHVYDRILKRHQQITFAKSSSMAPSFDRELNLYFSRDSGSGSLSLYKVERLSWEKQSLVEQVLVQSTKGENFYSVRFSGVERIGQSILASMPGEPRSSFGAVEHLGKIYVSGGHKGAEHTYPKESFSDELMLYDTQSNQWSYLMNRPAKAHGYALAANADYIYAFGGFAFEESTKPQWKSLPFMDRYNVKTQSWDKRVQMPRARSSNVVAKVGSKVYLIGGWDSTPKFANDYDGTFHAEIDVFDLETESFSSLAVKLPLKRRAFTAVVYQEKIYLIGGISEGASHFSLLDNVTEFDPATEQFSEMAKLPYATFAPAAGIIDGQIYMFGGMLKRGEWEYEYVSHIHSYDFGAVSWQNTGRYLSESKGFSQVVNWGKNLMVLGGHSYQDNSDSPVPTLEKFYLE